VPDRSELHPVYRLSGVARPVEPRFPTNKAVLVLMPLVFVLGAALRGSEGASWVDAGLAGLEAALLLFLAWALTRELSPDDNPAAFLAAGFALAGWARVGEQSLLILAATLLAVRLVNRSTGLPAKLGDSLIITVGFASLAWFVSWTCGVVGALALALDAVLPSKLEARRIHLLGAGLVALVVVARVVVGVADPQLPAHLPVFATIAGLGFVAALAYPKPSSVGDVDGQPLVPARVRVAFALGVLAAVLVSLDGNIPLQRVAGLWACVLASALGLPIVWLRRRRQ
jgi:hypothetical protein